MDPVIVNSIITGVTSIFTCALGLSLGRRDTNAPSAKKIYELQLINLYMPIDRIFSLKCNLSPSEILAKISLVIHENYVLLPPNVLNGYIAIMYEEDLTSEMLESFRTIIRSNYHWTKKRLGYPYDKRCIRKKDVPTYERNTMISTSVILICVLIWAIFVLISISGFNVSSQLRGFSIFIALLGIPFYIEVLVHQKKK